VAGASEAGDPALPASHRHEEVDMMARPFTGVAIDNITDLRAYIRGGKL
jgi:hypothetical protein